MFTILEILFNLAFIVNGLLGKLLLLVRSCFRSLESRSRARMRLSYLRFFGDLLVSSERLSVRLWTVISGR